MPAFKTKLLSLICFPFQSLSLGFMTQLVYRIFPKIGVGLSRLSFYKFKLTLRDTVNPICPKIGTPWGCAKNSGACKILGENEFLWSIEWWCQRGHCLFVAVVFYILLIIEGKSGM